MCATLELPIADQQIKLALADRDETAIKDVAEAKERDDVGPTAGGFGHQWESDAQETIEAEFFEDTRVQHCSRGGRGAVTERRPGVKRPE
jgi:hypothetical protein